MRSTIRIFIIVGSLIQFAPIANAVGETISEISSIIGWARMDAEGTIFLRLVAESPDGGIGDALLIFRTDNPDYKMIIDHLPNLKPGNEVPVPLFPSDK